MTELETAEHSGRWEKKEETEDDADCGREKD